MNIIARLRREVADYAKQHGYPHARYRPGRIVLKGNAAQEFADEMVKMNENLSIKEVGQRSPDEIFLDGGVAYFKGIPVIAELDHVDVLVVEDSE